MAELEGVEFAPVPSGKSWDLAGMELLSTSAVAGKVLAAMGDEDPDIVVLTADLKFSNQTVDFERAHPERFINVGISEQHMVTMAAGMASVGMKPYVATFAPFVGLLAGEHIRTDLAYPGLPVRIIAHHAGIAIGFYGTSHHATEDLGLMRSIAGLTVVCPCDATATEAALRQTADLAGPVYFRVGRGRDVDVYDERLPVRIWPTTPGSRSASTGPPTTPPRTSALLRSIAGMTVVCPCDATATGARYARRSTPGPVYLRLGRGRDARRLRGAAAVDPGASARRRCCARATT